MPHQLLTFAEATRLSACKLVCILSGQEVSKHRDAIIRSYLVEKDMPSHPQTIPPEVEAKDISASLKYPRNTERSHHDYRKNGERPIDTINSYLETVKQEAWYYNLFFLTIM